MTIRLRIACGLLATLGVLWSASAGGRYKTGPPPGHTGGSGEPDCSACHFDAPVNDPAGHLEISGIPDAYRPGAKYPLTVRLSHPEMSVAGFELSARTSAQAAVRPGEQAGAFAPGTGMAVDTLNGLHYLRHAIPAATTPDREAVQWTFTWQAPAERSVVVFHVAANAANGDDSEFGDFVYTSADSSDAN